MDQNTGAQPPVREPSFAERKAAQLSQERAQRPPEPEIQLETSRKKRSPDPELESAVTDPVEGDYDEEVEDEEGEELEAREGEPEGELDEDEDDRVDWRKRYQEAERKISEVTANRSAMEREHAEVMATTLSLRHNLEDQFTEAKRYASQYKVAFDSQISQLEQAFSTGQISPEYLPQARQQYQTLINQRNALVGQVEHITAQEAEARRIDRERKAEIARVRLARTIPNWSREKHRELGEYAQTRGFSPDEFNQNLDYRFLEILNDSMQLRRSADTVKQVRRQKKAGGPQRNAPVAARGSDGKFRKAQEEFRAHPNQKGRFAEMKFRQLQKDRQR